MQDILTTIVRKWREEMYDNMKYPSSFQFTISGSQFTIDDLRLTFAGN